MKKLLKSYFFWTYSRGSFHYDVLVTLILVFIFVSPRLWDYGDKPRLVTGPLESVTVISDGDHGLVITVHADEVKADGAVLTPQADASVLKRALKRAVEPVTSDVISLTRWQPVKDAAGNLTAWQVWVHR